MFAPLDNVLEDPATGSASAALAAHLLADGAHPDGEQLLVMEQGVELGRPSTLHLRVRIAAGAVREVFIEGRCVPVMHGTLEL